MIKTNETRCKNKRMFYNGLNALQTKTNPKKKKKYNLENPNIKMKTLLQS